MTRFAALLRGVNVGGVNLKMADVAAVFDGLGLSNVKTVLASGNVLFDSEEPAGALKPAIEKALGARFGYDASVHVLELERIARLVADFPFDAERAGWHPYVIFVAQPAIAAELLAVQPDLDADSERVAPGDNVVYWTVERGKTLSSVVGKKSVAARYKTATTTRNLRTLKKLLA